MKKLWNSLRGLSGNNRGSGIVVVLVSMACVALMGASLLFMSYTALRMRATERQASRDFYSAETAMDEIRAGVQSIASDAIADAYKSVLETYSTSSLIGQRFESAFVKALEKSSLLTNSGNEYLKSTLDSYVSAPSSEVKVMCGTDPDADTGTVVKLSVEDEDFIVLKDIHVTHTATNGYTTQISTDISIGMPDFAYIMSAASLSGLPQHALIANTSLNQTEGLSTIKIDGSAYVGRLDLGGNSGSKLTVSGGTLVCAGDTTVDGSTSSGRLETTADVKLWTGRITVKGGSSIKLNGETRVLDDLELAGGNAKAVLKGSYYGFGDEKNTPSGVNPAKYSSAILVNGLNSVLDLSGLDRLMLAGRSYISDSLYAGHSGTSASGIGMLESVAVRSNQQMYLIPHAELKVDFNKNGVFEANEIVDQNPFLTNVTGLLDPDEYGNYAYIALNTDGAANAENHGFKLTARQYPSSGSGGQQVVYCFMEFETPKAANTYFEQLSAQHSGQFNSYLVDDTDETEPIVVEKSNLDAFASYTSGYTIRGNNGAYKLARPTSAQFSPDGMLATYNQLKKTLIDANTAVPADTTPYTYIVDTDKVKALGEGGSKSFSRTLEDNSVVTGVVVNNMKNDGTKLSPYIIDGDTPNTLRLVIASGDVSISSSYDGLVISGGNIKLNSENVVVAADIDGVNNSFDAIAADNDILKNYLRNGVNTSSGTTSSGSAGSWKLDTLVTYRNWNKK